MQGTHFNEVRLKPLLDALCECELAIEREIEMHKCSCQKLELHDGQYEQFTCHLHVTLANLETVLKEMESEK